MNAATYARVSTTAQAQTGTSLGEQRRALEEFCRDQGLTLVEHVEDDYTGALLTRPGIERIKELVEAKSIQMLACYSLDRLARDNYLGTGFIRWLEKRDVETVFVNEKYARTPEGELFRGIRWEFAAYERRLITERTLRGRMAKAAAGHLPSRAEPYGYRQIRTDESRVLTEFAGRSGDLLIREDEAEIVRALFARYAAGETLRQLTKWLRESGHRTRRGKEWAASSVRYLLTSTVYAGTIRYGPHELAAPPLVSSEIWQRVQVRLGENVGGRPSDLWLLRGCVFCGQCKREDGRPYTCSGKRKSGSVDRPGYLYRCYQCNSARWNFCGALYEAKRLERMARRAMERYTREGEMAAFAAQEARRRERESGGMLAQLERLEKERQQLTEALSRVADQLLAGLVPPDIMAAKARELGGQRESLDARIRLLRAASPSLDWGAVAAAAEGRAREWRERTDEEPAALQRYYRDLLIITIWPDRREPVISPRLF